MRAMSKKTKFNTENDEEIKFWETLNYRNTPSYALTLVTLIPTQLDQVAEKGRGVNFMNVPQAPFTHAGSSRKHNKDSQVTCQSFLRFRDLRVQKLLLEH